MGTDITPTPPSQRVFVFLKLHFNLIFALVYSYLLVFMSH
jgi:hypothetical protein